MIDNKVMRYEAPRLTVVRFRAEGGFAVSGGGETINSLNLWQVVEYSEPEQHQPFQSYETHGSWTQGTDGFWQ